jgi:hypothetical protein
MIFSNKEISDMADEAWRNLNKDGFLEYSMERLYKHAWFAGFICPGKIPKEKSSYKEEYIETDIKERYWIINREKMTDEFIQVLQDLEMCKKYIRILMEWKNASNP